MSLITDRPPCLTDRCEECGFVIGDRVMMRSGMKLPAGTSPLRRGVVVEWHAGCGHIVQWDEPLGAPVTGLPNPNVRRELFTTATDEEGFTCDRCAESTCAVCGHDPCPCCLDCCDHPDCIKWDLEAGTGEKMHVCVFTPCEEHRP